MSDDNGKSANGFSNDDEFSSGREPNMIVPPPISNLVSGDYINLNVDPGYKYVDDILAELFDHHKMERLGGASGRGWSSHATFQRCPYLFKLKYLEGMRGPASPALEIGSLIHTFLALHYTWMLDENLTLTPQIAKDSLLAGGARPQSVIEAWRLYEAYAARYANDYLYPLAMEDWAQDPDGNTCRYDLIAEVKTAQPGVMPGTYIIEHKSHARFTADVLEGYRNDGEILGQIMIWKRAKLDKKYGKLRGTIVNIVGKQKIIQFHRTIIPAQRWHVTQHMEDLKMSAAIQQIYAATGVWPKWRANCVSRWGMCEFFDHCAENRKPVPIRKREWAPQAKPEIAAATESPKGLAIDNTIGQTSPTPSEPIETGTATAESEGSHNA
jgi:PD-(D/E)XK nuclease superfamily protein